VKFGGFDWDSGKCSNALSMAYRWWRSRPYSQAMFMSCAIRSCPASGEFLGFGNGAGRWIFRVFTWRGNRIRPVSVRFMHEKEVKLYVEEISRLEKR
jgi:hypothetical protein